MRTMTKAFLLISGVCVSGGTAMLASRTTQAQPQLPTPARLTANLDLACHKVTGGQTPVQSLTINHLNPVLQNMGFGREQAQLGALEQLCVPVQKNDQVPPPDVLPYIQYIDLACYQASSTISRAVPLNLTQLNPVLRQAGIPDHPAIIRNLKQLCVPVAKRGAEPPASVLELIQHIDVACYSVDEPVALPQVPLRLTDLNPLFASSVQSVQTRQPEQLCVPVAKSIAIPSAVANIVKWIDFEKFVTPTSTTTPMPIVLRHLNPQFSSLPQFQIQMLNISHLDVPVAKNGQLPPEIQPTLQ